MVVAMPDERRLAVPDAGGTTFDELADEVCQRLGLPMGSIRLAFDGAPLRPEWTPARAALESGDQVCLVPREGWCLSSRERAQR